MYYVRRKADIPMSNPMYPPSTSTGPIEQPRSKWINPKTIMTVITTVISLLITVGIFTGEQGQSLDASLAKIVAAVAAAIVEIIAIWKMFQGETELEIAEQQVKFEQIKLQQLQVQFLQVQFQAKQLEMGRANAPLKPS